MIDVLVAGGGPAGLVTALHARRAGLRVTVLEPRPAPIDKACGEGLMPGAVAALAALGVPVCGQPFVGIRYRTGGPERPRAASVRFRHGCGLGVRRVELHACLHRAAVGAGVSVVEGRAGPVVQDSASVGVGGLRARYLVGADGLHSSVRDAAGLGARTSRTAARWGIRAHYACAPWTDHVEVHWARDSEAYVTPVGPDCVGVAVLGGGHAPFAERLREFPALRERLPPEPVDRVRASGPLRQDVPGRVAGRIALVGDAAGYVDALTGEGLAIAFACAQALVRRIVADDLSGYERDYRALTRSYRLLTSSLLWAGGRSRLRRGIVPLAERAPWLFSAAVDQLAR